VVNRHSDVQHPFPPVSVYFLWTTANEHKLQFPTQAVHLPIGVSHISDERSQMATYSPPVNIGATPLNTGAYLPLQQPQQYHGSLQSPITAERIPAVHGNIPYLTGPNQLPSPVTQPPPVYTANQQPQMMYMTGATADHSTANRNDQLRGMAKACGIVGMMFIWVVGAIVVVAGCVCDCILHMLPD
jgi:hypothetical protein